MDWVVVLAALVVPLGLSSAAIIVVNGLREPEDDNSSPSLSNTVEQYWPWPGPAYKEWK